MRLARIIAAGAMALSGAACLYLEDDHHHGLDWAACQVPSSCTLTAARCCDVCGRPTLGDVDAVNRARLDEHFADVCPVPFPCPRCPVALNPELLATCRADHCLALDVRDLPLSTCATDDDCRLRTTGCCECGGATEPWALIALAVTGEAAYQQLVCDPGQACTTCAPVYPDTVEAYCAADQHCAVREVAPACTDQGCLAQGLTCCDDGCVGTYNDVRHCGACDQACGGAHPYCDGAQCAAAPPCAGVACAPPTFCCGGACCAPGELCCDVPGPGPGLGPRCVAPDARGTCPIGCPLCQ